MAIPWCGKMSHFAHQLSAKWVLKTAKPLELQPWPCIVITVVATVTVLIDWRQNNFGTPDPLVDDVIHLCCEVKGRAMPDYHIA